VLFYFLRDQLVVKKVARGATKTGCELVTLRSVQGST
jgi:hypothetical protein